MPSAVLVHPDGKARDSGLGVRIVSVETLIDHISLKAPPPAARRPVSGPFDFEVGLSESEERSDGMRVRFSYKFGRGTGQACSISGMATVRFSNFSPGEDFTTLGPEVTNEMAVEIFRKTYEPIYLLHDALALDAPSPWITQEVSLSSREHPAVRF